jgi:hypothetical protein
MGIKEVCSPANSRATGKLVSTQRAWSPGSRSAPGQRGDSAPPHDAGSPAHQRHDQPGPGVGNVSAVPEK